MNKKKLSFALFLFLLACVPLCVYAQDAPDLGEPFIGELVDVNGRSVLVHCVGEGSPTVWLENGWAAMVVTWQPFQDQLAGHTRVCAYDRAGMGWSDPTVPIALPTIRRPSLLSCWLYSVKASHSSS